MDSKSLKLNTKILINSFGLNGSKRGNRDGISYFGKANFDNQVDFELPDEEAIKNSHFLIKYDPNIKSYLIKNIQNSGLFLRIEYQHVSHSII